MEGVERTGGGGAVELRTLCFTCGCPGGRGRGEVVNYLYILRLPSFYVPRWL